MKQTKLYIALRSLFKEEWKSLQRYVIMETSNTSDAYNLFVYMYNCHKVNKTPSSKEETRAHLFPEMAEKRFLNLCSMTYLIFEDWLVWYEIKKDKVLCGIHLVKAYNRRGIFELADKTFARVHKKLSQQGKIDLKRSDYMHKLYKYHYFSENPVKNREGKELLEKLVEYWMHSYKEISHLYIAQMYNWGDSNNFDYSETIRTLENSIANLLTSKTSEVTKIIQNLSKEEDQKSLDKLYKLLINEEIEKGSDLEVFITLYSILYSVKMWNEGKLKNKAFIFKIYDYGLSSTILMNLGKMQSNSFLNMISVIVLTSRAEMTYQFIDKWSHIIDSSDKETAVAIAKCYVKREEGKFKDIILLLRSLHSKNLRLTLLSLIFLIKAFYMEKEYELAQNTIDNFKRRLRKTKTGSEKAFYLPRLNFLLVMEQLIKSKHRKISINLDKYKHLHHRIWLSKQINKSKGT